MAEPDNHECPNCKRLERRVAELEARLVQLENELAKARKTSATSSKPPSSDIVRPPHKVGKGKRGKRKRGAQPGHPRHERTPFAEEELDNAWEYRLDNCPCCHGELKDLQTPPKRLQQVELREVPVIIEEHRGIAQWCKKCRRAHYGGLPDATVKRFLGRIGGIASADPCERVFRGMTTLDGVIPSQRGYQRRRSTGGLFSACS